jgi:hypothetical protein
MHVRCYSDQGKKAWLHAIVAAIRAKAAEACPRFEIEYLLPGRNGTDPKAFSAEMRELTFFHLRHTAVTRLAEVECEAPLISAITGHSLKAVESILSRYLVRTPQAPSRNV